MLNSGRDNNNYIDNSNDVIVEIMEEEDSSVPATVPTFASPIPQRHHVYAQPPTPPDNALTPLVSSPAPIIPETEQGYLRRMMAACLPSGSCANLTGRKILAGVTTGSAAFCSAAGFPLSLGHSITGIIGYYVKEDRDYPKNYHYSFIYYLVKAVYYLIVLTFSASIFFQRLTKNTIKVEALLAKIHKNIYALLCCSPKDPAEKEEIFEGIDAGVIQSKNARANYALFSKEPVSTLGNIYHVLVKFFMTGIAEFFIGSFTAATMVKKLIDFVRLPTGGATTGIVWTSGLLLGLANVTTFSAVVGHENDSYSKRLVLWQHIDRTYDNPTVANSLKAVALAVSVVVTGIAVIGAFLGDFSTLEEVGETIFDEIGSTLYYKGFSALLLTAVSITKAQAYFDKIFGLFFLGLGGQFWSEAPIEKAKERAKVDKFTLVATLFANVAKSFLGTLYYVTAATGGSLLLGGIAGLLLGIVSLIMTLALLKDLPTVCEEIMNKSRDGVNYVSASLLQSFSAICSRNNQEPQQQHYMAINDEDGPDQYPDEVLTFL